MSSTPDQSGTVPRGLVEAWRADGASPAELRRGYARFLRARPSRRPAAVIARWLVVGLILGAGLAQGATVAARRWQAATALSLHAPQPPRASEQSGAARGALPTAVASSAAPAEPAALRASEPSRAAYPALPSPAVVAAPGPSLASGASAPTVQQQRWQRVAAAMRARDFTTAQAALQELELTTQGSEREAVLLARAQLLASSGRSGEALALARELEQRASSHVMRDKARELLARLRENVSPDRSNSPAAAIKQP